MNEKHKEIRTQISVMSRERALYYISGFHLLPDEEAFIIEREVDGMQIPAIAEKHNVCTETVIRRRHDAFRKICDAIEFRKEHP